MERKLLTVAQFAQETPFSEASIRWMIFNAASNGLANHSALVRIRRRVYLDPAAFNRWIDSQNPKGKAA